MRRIVENRVKAVGLYSKATSILLSILSEYPVVVVGKPLADSTLCIGELKSASGPARGEFIRVLRRRIELRTLAITELAKALGRAMIPGFTPSLVDCALKESLNMLISALLSPIAHCSISCSLSRLRWRYSIKASRRDNDTHNSPTTTPIISPSLLLIPLAPAALIAAVLAVLGALTAGVM